MMISVSPLLTAKWSHCAFTPPKLLTTVNIQHPLPISSSPPYLRFNFHYVATTAILVGVLESLEKGRWRELFDRVISVAYPEIEYCHLRDHLHLVDFDVHGNFKLSTRLSTSPLLELAYDCAVTNLTSLLNPACSCILIDRLRLLVLSKAACFRLHFYGTELILIANHSTYHPSNVPYDLTDLTYDLTNPTCCLETIIFEAISKLTNFTQHAT